MVEYRVQHFADLIEQPDVKYHELEIALISSALVTLVNILAFTKLFPKILSLTCSQSKN